MKKKVLILAIVAFAAVQTQISAQSKWVIDAIHSSVRFSVTHMAISTVEGSFKKFDSYFTSSAPDFTDAKINFTVETKSVFTDNDMRDNDLRSDNYFSAEKFTQMKFVSTSMTKTGDKKYILEGDLTIKDVTKRVKFEVTFGGTAKDYKGNINAGFKAVTTIKREDFHVGSSSAMVGDDVDITINLAYVQQPA